MFRPEKFTHKKACILGAGKSGIEAAKLLARHGFSVLISDEKKHTKLPALPACIKIETGKHSARVFACDFIVKSPGIFPKAAVLKEARKRKIPIFSELEVALAFMPKDICVLAVSGTNGKTTTTTLLGEIIQEHGHHCSPKRNTFITGNIGTPVCQVAEKIKPHDFLVIEVSSYQLEDSTYFRPKVACLLNITPDHLDHHGGMVNYIKAKARLFKNQRSSDVAVLNGGDAFCAALARDIKAQVYAFSTQVKHELKTDVFFDGDEIIFSEGYHLRAPKLPGIHNVENAMAAALAALSIGVSAKTIQTVFNRFKPIEHRIEPVGTYKGVLYINDSKATNLDSTLIALKSFDREKRIWLILGGRDKGASYEVLAPEINARCKGILTIGESMDKIKRELNAEPKQTSCFTLEKAVEYAAAHAQKGDIVLLSPACASFDQFKSFEHRGEVFKKLVLKQFKK